MARIKELTIENMSYDAMGVAYCDDKVYLVDGAIIGEKVEALIPDDAKKVCPASIKKMIEESPFRIKPMCKYFGLCGGCNMMHIAYQHTLDIKRHFIEETMRKIGHLDISLTNVIGMDDPLRFRNKLQFPVSYFNGKVNIGYFKRGTHNVIAIDDCFIQSENVTNILNELSKILNELNFSIYNEKLGKGVLRHVIVRENEIGEVMLIFVSNIFKDKVTSYFSKLCQMITSAFACIKSIYVNINNRPGNVILGNEALHLFGSEFLTYNVLGIKYNISYNSFFQVNTVHVGKLYKEALRLANLNGYENVIDAYCGVGSISLLLAKKTRHVYGIEIVKEAVENAKKNAILNNINNCDFILGKVEDKINDLLSLDIDLIVFDPPRKGLDASIIQMLKETKIKNIVYVSCNYATLARDINLLSDLYYCKEMCAVDMFAWSSEVETVCKLELK